MFFVRQRRVKIIGVLLLLNVTLALGEAPLSSYLPPSRDDERNQFTGALTGSSYNPNSPPIETSVSLTTNEPFTYSSYDGSGDTRGSSGSTYPNTENFSEKAPQSGGTRGPSGNSFGLTNDNFFANRSPQSGGTRSPGNVYGAPSQLGETRGPSPSNTYGPPNNNFSGNRPTQSGETRGPVANTYGSSNTDNLSVNRSPSNFGGNAFNRGSTERNQQPAAGNAGYSYQQPNPPFREPNKFTQGAGSNGGQNFQPGSPTEPSGISNAYFIIPTSPSSSYGAPLNNTGGNFGTGQGSRPFNVPDRKSSATPPNASPSPYRPSSNNQPGVSTSYGAPTGNTQGSSQSGPNLSSSYGPPNPSFGNFQQTGSSFNPPNPSNTPLNGNRNPFSPAGTSNSPNTRPLGGSGSNSNLQTLYGPPTSATYPDSSNSPSKRPGNSFGGSATPSTPNTFATQGNRNNGNFGPPSPTYGTPNSPAFGSNQQSFRPQEPQRLGQNNHKFGSSGATYQNVSNQGRPSPSQLYGAPSQNPSGLGYSQGQNQGGGFGRGPSSPRPEYNTGSNQARPSSSGFSAPGYPQNLQNQQSSYSSPASNIPKSYQNNAPSPTYGSPSTQGNVLTSPGRDQTSYAAPNVNQSPSQSFAEKNQPQSFYLPPSFNPPSNPSNSGFGNAPYEASRPPTRNPSGSPPTGSLPPSSYGAPTANTFSQGPSSQTQQGYPSSSLGFSSNNELSSPDASSSSSGYGAPTRDYTDAVIGDRDSSSFNSLPFAQENTFSTPSSIGQFSDTDGNSQSSFTSADQGGPAQSAYSAFSPNPSSFELPSKLYGPPRPSNDLPDSESSLPFTPSGSASPGTQSEVNFNTNPESSYLPPNYSDNTAFSFDDIVPSTSYNLPSDQPNSRPDTSNTVKNVNRNVGSDLITGASTSPFKPFKDDIPSVPPSRTTYEKSQEITSNDLASSELESSKPAKYEFNYNVKEAGTEFNHQESRNGTNISGSYGVVLPDGRKQVVDYEANQEGFHPKIRYEKTPANSLQGFGQNNAANLAQQGYNYSPGTPSGQNFSQPTPHDLFDNPASNQNYQELQPPFSNRPDYSIGTTANQDTYTLSHESTSAQSGYPTNNQGSISNFNTYSNHGTSPSNQDGSSFEPSQSSDFDNNQGYDYPPVDNTNNQVTGYDSGYPTGPNFKPGSKTIPLFE